MRRFFNNVAIGCLGLGLLVLATSSLPAQEEVDEGIIEMIAVLVGDTDLEMRALGFQQIREENPGEAATLKFTEMLANLPPDGQAGLLEALGGRGDKAALPTVLESLESEDESIRAAALGTLGDLGGTAEVALLAEKAADGSDAEKSAARKGLARLRGEDVNATIEAAATDGSTDVRVALLGVLADRNARESLFTVLESAQDTEPTVRRAALEALRYLADENNTAELVALLKDAADDEERRTAELSLLTVCSRGREACTEAVAAGFDGADATSRVVLLRVLARAGGPKALEAIAGRLRDVDQNVCDEAVRMVSRSSDPAATLHLLPLAEAANRRHQILALRGIIRQARPKPATGADEVEQPANMKLLGEAMRLARRPEEKRLVLGVLGGIATSESAALIAPALDDPETVDEAGLAIVQVAEKMGPQTSTLKDALKKVLDGSPKQDIQQRAKKVLDSL